MSMSNSMPPRPTLLTTAALAETVSEAPPAPVSANPQAGDATTRIFFYVLLGFIMISLIFGLFPQ